jgi:hypothetical protein
VVVARSAAITAAAPRKNANGEASIRPLRIGTSSGTRVAACASRMATGSGRSAAGCQPACPERGHASRAARPAAARSAGLASGPPSIVMD